MGFLAIPLLPKCSTDLKYGPCPPARDWGSRVSGLVFSNFISFFPKSKSISFNASRFYSLSLPNIVNFFCTVFTLFFYKIAFPNFSLLFSIYGNKFKSFTSSSFFPYPELFPLCTRLDEPPFSLPYVCLSVLSVRSLVTFLDSHHLRPHYKNPMN